MYLIYIIYQIYGVLFNKLKKYFFFIEFYMFLVPIKLQAFKFNLSKKNYSLLAHIYILLGLI
jgi:hypothetical protein